MTIDAGVKAHVAELLDEYLSPGDDADAGLDPADHPVAIRAGTAVFCVRLVDGQPPVLRVFSTLVSGVDASAELLAELNEANAHLSFVRLYWRDDGVHAATEVVADGLSASALNEACDTVAEVADYYDELLQDRFGGELTGARRRGTV